MQHPQQQDSSLLAVSAALAREPSSEVFSAVEKFIAVQLEAASAAKVGKDDREMVLGRINAYQSLIFAFRQARKVADSPEAIRSTFQKKVREGKSS